MLASFDGLTIELTGGYINTHITCSVALIELDILCSERNIVSI